MSFRQVRKVATDLQVGDRVVDRGGARRFVHSIERLPTWTRVIYDDRSETWLYSDTTPITVAEWFDNEEET